MSILHYVVLVCTCATRSLLHGRLELFCFFNVKQPTRADRAVLRINVTQRKKRLYDIQVPKPFSLLLRMTQFELLQNTQLRSNKNSVLE